MVKYKTGEVVKVLGILFYMYLLSVIISFVYILVCSTILLVCSTIMEPHYVNSHFPSDFRVGSLGFQCQCAAHRYGLKELLYLVSGVAVSVNIVTRCTKCIWRFKLTGLMPILG
jgi:hypothetical protein